MTMAFATNTLAPMSTNDTPLRAAVCGYGALGHVHADDLVQVPGVEPVAVCDIRPQQFEPREAAFNLKAGERRFDVRSVQHFTDWRQMLREARLDLLVVALPTDLHAQVSIAALEAGVHVLCEKPMALTAADAVRMAEASERTGRRLMIGQCLRFWPEYEALARLVRERPYGPLRALRMFRTGGYSEWSAENWFNDHRRSGGAILDLHLHDVDWVAHVLGAPRAILASGRTGKSGGIDDVTAVFDYGDCHATIVGSWMYSSFRMAFEAVFEDATVAWDGSQPMSLRRRGGEPEPVPVEKGSAYVRELAYLCQCIRENRAPERCLPRSTAETVRLVELERRSISERAWITP